MKTIVGGGLAGLIAAHAWPQATVLEAAQAPAPSHRALLRFRSDAVARLTGIEFKKVRVNKGIWFDGSFIGPNIRAANLYSQKVLGSVGDRSIWNLDAVDRYIAPPDFYEQLIQSVGSRIMWGVQADFHGMHNKPFVSTAPMPVALGNLRRDTFLPPGIPEFKRKGIRVRRWELKDANVFQTVYYPEHVTTLYRASITGNTLIAEFADMPTAPINPSEQYGLHEIERSFGIDLGRAKELERVDQKFGKIEPIPDDLRKEIMFWMTQTCGIYSLGRFATWRNILLDDVVSDIDVIKRLARRSTNYDLRKA
jgi:hypothetical protein